jgi:hypothetical protein
MIPLDELSVCGVISSSSLQLIKCLSGGMQDALPLESWGMEKAATVSQELMWRSFVFKRLGGNK